MAGRLLFNTDSLPQRDRFPALCEEVLRRYTGLDFSTRNQSAFHASIELQRAGTIDIGHNYTTPINSARTRSLIRDGDDSILVTLFKRGQGFQTQRENDQRLLPGDGIICDCAYPGELNFTAKSEFWHLKMPRRKMVALLPHVTEFGGIRLDRNATARRLLFGYLAGTFDIDLSAGGRAVELYEEHILALVALALGAEDRVADVAGERSVAAVRRAAILRDIEDFMSDPRLNTAAVAARLNISPRYLRMLLEQTGRSFSEHVLEKRLQRAAAMLRDPAQRHRKIADVAFACGFGDLSYFNRCFRRRYGATPSDVRDGAQGDKL